MDLPVDPRKRLFARVAGSLPKGAFGRISRSPELGDELMLIKGNFRVGGNTPRTASFEFENHIFKGWIGSAKWTGVS